MISGLGEDMAALEVRIGQRGAVQALGVARDAGELSRARRLAEAMGGRTRAALKLLGSAALVLKDVLAVVLQAAWMVIGWMAMASLLARQLGMGFGRAIWTRPKPARPLLIPG